MSTDAQDIPEKFEYCQGPIQNNQSCTTYRTVQDIGNLTRILEHSLSYASYEETPHAHELGFGGDYDNADAPHRTA